MSYGNWWLDKKVLKLVKIPPIPQWDDPQLDIEGILRDQRIRQMFQMDLRDPRYNYLLDGNHASH